MTLWSNPKRNAGQRNRCGWFSKTGSRSLYEVNQSGCYCCLSVSAISFSMSANKRRGELEMTTSEYEDVLKKKRSANQTACRWNSLKSLVLKEEVALYKEKANLAEKKLTDLHAGQTRSESGPHPQRRVLRGEWPRRSGRNLGSLWSFVPHTAIMWPRWRIHLPDARNAVI